MSNVLDKSLTILYQTTLESGRIPSGLKHAEVTAILKRVKGKTQMITDQ